MCQILDQAEEMLNIIVLGWTEVSLIMHLCVRIDSFRGNGIQHKPLSYVQRGNMVGEKVQTSIYSGLKGVQWKNPILQSSKDLFHSVNRHKTRQSSLSVQIDYSLAKTLLQRPSLTVDSEHKVLGSNREGRSLTHQLSIAKVGRTSKSRSLFL